MCVFFCFVFFVFQLAGVQELAGRHDDDAEFRVLIGELEDLIQLSEVVASVHAKHVCLF